MSATDVSRAGHEGRLGSFSEIGEVARSAFPKSRHFFILARAYWSRNSVVAM